MKYISLKKNGVALIQISLAAYDGVNMRTSSFIVDTGATVTTINKNFLTETLGYTADYLENNKILIPDEEKPKMVDGMRADVYKIPAIRMNIGGYELKSDNPILTSDTINLNCLLGLDILQYFNFSYDFDSIDNEAPYGKMLYTLRDSRKKEFSSLQEPFAYQLEESHLSEERLEQL
jgi:hypothetical protein